MPGNAGVLNIVGENHLFINWFPDGKSAGGKGWIGWGDYATTAFAIYNYEGDIVMIPNGGVGIGITDPGSNKLYVAGAAYSSGGWSGSDERWKKNIEPLEDSLEKVNQLQGVSFDWRIDEYPDQGFTEGKQIGLIAQEVEEVIPEIVHTNDDGYKSVSYEKLTAVMVEAIKTQQKQLEEKQAQIEELMTRISALEAAIGEIVKR